MFSELAKTSFVVVLTLCPGFFKDFPTVNHSYVYVLCRRNLMIKKVYIVSRSDDKD